MFPEEPGALSILRVCLGGMVGVATFGVALCPLGRRQCEGALRIFSVRRFFGLVPAEVIKTTEIATYVPWSECPLHLGLPEIVIHLVVRILHDRYTL